MFGGRALEGARPLLAKLKGKSPKARTDDRINRFSPDPGRVFATSRNQTRKRIYQRRNFPEANAKRKLSVLQTRLAATLNDALNPDLVAWAFSELRYAFGDRSIVPDIAAFVWQRIRLCLREVWDKSRCRARTRPAPPVQLVALPCCLTGCVARPN